MNARQRRKAIPKRPHASTMARVWTKLKAAGKSTLWAGGNECWSPRPYFVHVVWIEPKGKQYELPMNTPLTPRRLERAVDALLGQSS